MTLLAAPHTLPQPLFADVLATHGASPALVTPAGTLSYAQLDARVAAVADRLGHPRRLVLVAADSTVDTVVTYLAALRGHHPVLLAPARDEHALRALVEAYDPDVLVGDGDIVDRRPRSRHALHPDLALLLSTSGSTGTPKLVRLSRHNLASNAAAIAEYLGIGPADRALTTLPMQYCYGLSVVNSHLHAGASIVLTDLSVVDACLWDLFRTARATSLAGVPHTFELLDRVGFDAMELPTLRYMTQAGGRMDPDTVRRYARLGERRGWQLFVMYGQTEATARMAYLPPELAATRPGAIGMPIPGGELTIDGPDDEGVGELVYRGPNVMLGYATQPADLARGGTIDALRTGDLARRADDGLFEIVGRLSRFVKPFGVRVDLDHLERYLAARNVTALCTGDDQGLVVGIDTATDADLVRSLVDERLRLPASRLRVLRLADLPRLSNGKPDYTALRHAAAHDLATRTAAASDDTVRAAFAQILVVDPGDGDTFVSLGGDSLSYVEMSVRLEEILGTVPRDWHTRTIRDLASAPVQRRRRVALADTSMVLRAAAIVLVVGTHTDLWHHPGGAHALLAVAGYNFARFQLGRRTMAASIARIALPSMGWIGIVVATSDSFAWPHALLLNGPLGDAEARWAYWFVEALVHILVPLALVSAVPLVFRFQQRHRFTTAMAAVAAGLLVRFDVVASTTDHRVFRPHEVFWLFALGWAAARADTWPRRALVTAVGIVAVSGFFGDPHRELIVAAAITFVVWLPTVPLPRLAVGPIAKVAGASLYIYLTHFQVYPPVTRSLGPAAAVVASVTVGIAVWAPARRAIAMCERWNDARAVPGGWGAAVPSGRGR